MINKIRENILTKFKDLQFNSVDHSYHLNNQCLTATTNIIKKFKTEFDTERIATQYAKKHKLKTEDVIVSWSNKTKESGNVGTKVHDFAERYFYDKTLKPSSRYEEAIINFWKTIPDTIIPLLAETRVYSKELGFAGTFDLLLYCTDRNTLIPCDWKTNADLYKNFRGQHMLSPFDFLLDMPFSHYEIQLSMYQIPLENLGYKISNRYIIWLKEDGTFERISTTDYTNHLRYYMTLGDY